MKHARFNKLVALFIAFAFALQVTLPSVAFADQRTVDLDNHTAQTDQAALIADITIDNVDKPTAGIALDDKATVTAAGDATWEIPVIWVRDDLQIDADEADEGHTYLPALAFFVPQGYALETNTFTVTLSDSVSQLFGTNEIVSVYNEATGITYIIPASLIDLFAQSHNEATQDEPADAQAEPADVQAEPADEEEEPIVDGYGDGQTLVEIHCAQTARDAFTDEDLEWLVELVRDYLEPQAVNLLLGGFTSFNEAAKNGEMGKELSLYIYYKNGDNDGNPDHVGAKGAMAYINADGRTVDGERKYCYMMGMDIDGLVKKDENKNPIRDPKTGRFTLLRDGMPFETLKNTIVHELFHAMMDDYNRTGMSGTTDLKGLETDSSGNFLTQEQADRYLALQFPQWFIEGSASAVEGDYAFRNYVFQGLRRLQGKDGTYGTGDYNPTFTTKLLIDNYINARDVDGVFWYYDLMFAPGGKDSDDKEIETEGSRYVVGCLATLYLSDLAVRYNHDNKDTSVKVVDGVTTVDALKLRDGLDSLLSWSHKGSTMDDIVNALSPKDEKGQPIYKDTAEFEKLFIKGAPDAKGAYSGDTESVTFVNTLLNYLLYLDNKLPDGSHPNGSILEDFSVYYTSLIDQSKKTSSSCMKVINSNEMIPSTVKSDTTGIGAGKSNPDKAKATGTTASKDVVTETASATAAADAPTDQQTALPADVKSGAASEAAVVEADVIDEATVTGDEPSEPMPADEAVATDEVVANEAEPVTDEPVAATSEAAGDEPAADGVVADEAAAAADEAVAAADGVVAAAD